jgi:N-acetylglucosaminyldiphosphoundecaprenol N-acetyl-beta-D-mannosaminyltransferase
MIDRGRHPILGVNVSAVDYEAAVVRIVDAAQNRQPLAVSALAVHGVMTGWADAVHRRRLNGLDIVTPDGQPVRWALKWLHGVSLPDRVYGPDLTKHVAKALADSGLSVYLYGSEEEVLRAFAKNLQEEYPNLEISGVEASKFRRVSLEERDAIVERIVASGASAVFVGLGCPRQEVWAYEHRDLLNIPILAVGAAFDFHAGTLPQAPRFMQDRGLEWLFRLVQEPGRLWRRYLILNPLYLWNILLEYSKLKSFTPSLPDGSEPLELYG